MEHRGVGGMVAPVGCREPGVVVGFRWGVCVDERGVSTPSCGGGCRGGAGCGEGNGGGGRRGVAPPHVQWLQRVSCTCLPLPTPCLLLPTPLVDPLAPRTGGTTWQTRHACQMMMVTVVMMVVVAAVAAR